ncbi:TPA: hypothetical protein N0F65_011312 [Lagenidium giganteum]|uniref:RNA helicase n=1 Tax=Lagenidium giganteum TaxID=4803 RepID=A0AAV2YIZ2_9STRA|nr:TPA: hypothetical protein N0F65_011312 [Lagenidium giganteum]
MHPAIRARGTMVAEEVVVGYEFQRDEEEWLHDTVLRTQRQQARTRFRPGVFAATGLAADVVDQTRSRKKVARAIGLLRDEYDLDDDAALREALSYTNTAEDALEFLALQLPSAALPRRLRALPVVPSDTKAAPSGAPAPEVVVAKVPDSWDDSDDDHDKETSDVKEPAPAPAPAPAPVAVVAAEEPPPARNEQKTEALSWTQRYLLQMEQEAMENATRKTKKPTAEDEIAELEAQYVELVAQAKKAKQDKVAKKRQKQLAQQTQVVRAQLVARGWQEADYHMRMNKARQEEEAKEAAKKEEPTNEPAPQPLPTTVAASVDSKDKNEDDDDDDGAMTCNLFGSNDDDDDDDDAKPAAKAIDDDDVEDMSGGLFDSTGSPDPSPVVEVVIEVAEEPTSKGPSKGRKKGKGGAAPAAGGKTWTGKTPRDHLDDYCKKNKVPRPQYKKLSNGPKVSYSVQMQKPGGPKREYVLLPEHCDAVFHSVEEGKDSLATRVLYELNPGLPMYRVLPPQYRDLWLRWDREQQRAIDAAKSSEKQEFDDLVEDIWREIPTEVQKKHVQATEPEPSKKDQKKAQALKDAAKTEDDKEQGHGNDDVVVDNWEDWDADDSGTGRGNTIGELESWEDMCNDDASTSSASATEVVMESEADMAESSRLRELVVDRQRKPKYIELLRKRDQLPIVSFKQQIVDALAVHDVILISGETGCGKSTQVPQFLLEDIIMNQNKGAHCRIVCTQPRRLAAISLAERVSTELGESTLGRGDALCGYQIRLENRMTDATRLLFCTTGILLRKLQDPHTLEDELSHIIVDEVHERDLQSDVLLSLLQRFLQTNQASTAARRKRGAPPLKIVLMSATMNAATFQTYFGGPSACIMLQVPGRTFPVEEFYLEDAIEVTDYQVDETSPCYVPMATRQESTQVTISGRGGKSYSQKLTWEASTSGKRRPSKSDTSNGGGANEDEKEYSDRTLKTLDSIDPAVINYDLLHDLIVHLVTTSPDLQPSKSSPSASILLFLPGLQEITTLLDMLGGARTFRDETKFRLLPLHSSLSSQDQQRVFDMPPGVVRVIASTNIAETSLTIEDVKVVIDTGRVKEMRHDSTFRTNVLEEIWTSRANARQRMGRAGRTSGGVCYRLFPRSVYLHVMDEQPVPEIRRSPLTSLCLQIKTLGTEADIKCGDFLAGCIDPPDERSVSDALEELYEIGALDAEDERLTTLGAFLAKLPVDVKVGKVLLLGAMFDLFDPISTCAAILETRSPFAAPFGRQDEVKAARKRFALAQNDLLTDVNAFEAWRALQTQNRDGKPSTSHRARERDFCRQYCLNIRAMNEISKLKNQFYGLVAQCGLLPARKPEEPSRMTRQQVAVVSGIIFAGLTPNLGYMEHYAAQEPRPQVFREKSRATACIHPSSVVHKVMPLPSAFVTFPFKLHTSQVYLPTVSPVSRAAMCLFSRDVELVRQVRKCDTNGGEVGLRVDEWVVLQTSWRSAVLFLELRRLIMTFIENQLASPPHTHKAKHHRLSKDPGSNGNSDEDELTHPDVRTVVQRILQVEFEEMDAKGALTVNLNITEKSQP